MKHETKKLIEAFKKHKNIIIGVDFDDTIFPFDKSDYVVDRCKLVVKLLQELKEVSTICLFSVADKQSLVYKEHIMDLYGIKPMFINESLIKKWGECNKPYFNILLDDKAGLNEAIEILKEFKQEINNIEK